MPSLLIRNVSEKQIIALNEMAQKSKKSREGFLREQISQVVVRWDPEIILGFIQLQRGDHLGDSTCECGQEFCETGIWIGFTANLEPFGPVCSFCAEIDEGVISVEGKSREDK